MPSSSSRSASYKWIALSNTTLGILMASINGTILIIALPVVFQGIQVDPLNGGQTSLLLWVLLGFNVATTVLLVTFGRLSDMYGRVRLYNLGFLIFTIGSVLLSLTWGKGLNGEIQLIVFRIVQGIGGAFLFSNSAAILTDAFPGNQRGLALGLNQIAGIGGGVIGLVVGGLLAASGHWRWVFLVNVPIGIAGTIWAYVALKELTTRPKKQKIDIWGNLTLAGGITILMLGLTYGIMPYGNHAMGWTNPWVLAGLIGGVVLLGIFCWVETLVEDPMFHLHLFRIRAFTFGNLSSFFSALARGGLQFMLIIWLQGIWLPLHGVSYTDTPLQAGIDTLPQMVGFLVAGPISGYLSDRFGARLFATGGMVLSAIGFLLLLTLPFNFTYWPFAIYLFIIGCGMGLFASPNSAAIMNSVPARYRGVASGMRATFMNAGQMMSMGIFFSIVISGLAAHLPHALTVGLSGMGVPAQFVAAFSKLPPTAALFAALLGYNPMQHLIPAQILHLLSPHNASVLVGTRFFPQLIGPPFMHGLADAFWISFGLSVAAALASLLRGKHFVLEEEDQAPAQVPADTLRQLQVVGLLAAWHARQGASPQASELDRQRLHRALSLLRTVAAEKAKQQPQEQSLGS
ncbi:MFS transporter [Alicyclobacillus cycloheptanicus]|uniref:EmrB/QacA subfamily drug resistance transporter n=1 Tax=Alicyclobacillus cycloheptanicus TaxID=1457 RepID=A0ABT9XG87_9BACL|nr:MFS transporter [Alicyclobacillus cycloheptanicus]MDQ0189212.1 EmrB/QacA subfamily drug resistance transporter [Alicyclobacillus cycloheptanicus]WDM00397.1 MFS transporter [Alicyclobacillus cycloheptanicus]